MKTIRCAAKALVVEAGCLLAIENRNAGEVWYTLPGGGVSPEETLVEALRRECREEIDVEVEPLVLRYVRDYRPAAHPGSHSDPDVHQIEFIFTCRVARGEPRPGPARDRFMVACRWVPLDQLAALPFRPRALAKLLTDGTDAPTYLGDVP